MLWECHASPCPTNKMATVAIFLGCTLHLLPTSCPFRFPFSFFSLPSAHSLTMRLALYVSYMHVVSFHDQSKKRVLCWKSIFGNCKSFPFIIFALHFELKVIAFRLFSGAALTFMLLFLFYLLLLLLFLCCLLFFARNFLWFCGACEIENCCVKHEKHTHTSRQENSMP